MSPTHPGDAPISRLLARNPISVLVAVAAIIVLALGILLVGQTMTAHASAARVQQANAAVDGLLNAAAYLARERGLTAAALGGVGREEINDELETTRQRADEYWHRALTQIEDLAHTLPDTTVLDNYNRRAREAWHAFLRARAQVDEALTNGTDPPAPDDWIETVTELIAVSGMLRDQVLLSVEAPMDVVRLNLSVKQSAWQMSENAGQIRAILAFYAGTREPMAEAMLEQVYANRRATQRGLDELLVLRDLPDTPDHLREALDLIETVMEEQFYPAVRAMLAAAGNGDYPFGPLEWFGTATQHIDHVLAASAIVSEMTADRIHTRARRAYVALAIFAVLTILAALLALASLMHVRGQSARWRRMEEREHQRNRMLTALATGRPLTEILERIVTSMEEETPGALCSILLVDSASRRLTVGAAPRLPDFYNQAVDGTPIGEKAGACGAAAHTGRRVIVEDILHHPHWESIREPARSAGLRACWSEPVISSGGEVIATFAVYHRVPRTPTNDDIERIQRAADLASLAIERKKLEEELERRASHDHLTGLYNRETLERLIQTEIQRAARYRTQFSIVMLDIDHFKPINDRYGHPVGDEVLIRFAREVTELIRAADTLARWGGEEFMLLLPETGIDGAARLAEEIRVRVAETPFPKVGEVTISLGVTEYSPPEAPRNLLKRLDDALYQAKETGRNRVMVTPADSTAQSV